MKRPLLIYSLLLASLFLRAQIYPEGTRWTEIRLDTVLYADWFSAEGDTWVANFDTLTYYVKGDTTLRNQTYRCLYMQTEGTDSLCFFLEDHAGSNMVSVAAYEERLLGPSLLYDFNWKEGNGYYSTPLLNSVGGNMPADVYYGHLASIGERSFNGVRPLKYADFNARIKVWSVYSYYPVRMIQGIGVTTWNGPECLMGPMDIHTARRWVTDAVQSHHRSMLVHFERNGEVLYDVWPQPGDRPDGVAQVRHSATPGPLYDLQGRRLAKRPRRGMYIENGRVRIK